jgi:hypothetical protein
MTTDEVHFERGVSRRHGYLTEFYVDDPEYIVKVPDGLRDVAVIAEMSLRDAAQAIRDLALTQAQYPGWAARLYCGIAPLETPASTAEAG